MKWYLVFHIVGFVIWVGTLLDLTRILGYHVKEEIAVQERLSRMEFRMYWFVATIGLALTVIFGLLLFFSNGGFATYVTGPFKWFVAKFCFVLSLVVIHILFGRYLMELKANPRKMNPARFKILHGLTGLIFISILIMVLVKPF